jgi:hypothetical protein
MKVKALQNQYVNQHVCYIFPLPSTCMKELNSDWTDSDRIGPSVLPRGLYVLWSVQWLGHLLPPVFDWLQGFMCVCTQVSSSVVSNWPLSDLFVDMCIVIFCL